MKRVAEVLQYLTLFLAAWFIASRDHPIAIAAGAAIAGVASLVLVSAARRKANPPDPVP